MSTSIITVRPETPVTECIDLLSKHRISGMPVVSDEMDLEGVISEKDTFKLILKAGYTRSMSGTVADYMTREVDTVHPDDDVFKLANMFYDHNYRRLPVIENDKVVVIISRRDILKSIQKMGH